MQLPKDYQQTYWKRLKTIEDMLNDAMDSDRSGNSSTNLKIAQEKLDELADTYQDDEKLGPDRYKLYELQGVIHILSDKEQLALKFIEHAISIKGKEYTRANILKGSILSSKSNEKTANRRLDKSTTLRVEKKDPLVGFKGFLALFMIGLGISFIFNLYITIASILELFNGPENTELVPAIVITSLTASAIAWIFYLFSIRQKIAKPVAIIVIIIDAILGLLITVNTNYTNNYDLGYGKVAWAFLIGSIWIRYLLTSKRVKATLTEDSFFKTGEKNAKTWIPILISTSILLMTFSFLIIHYSQKHNFDQEEVSTHSYLEWHRYESLDDRFQVELPKPTVVSRDTIDLEDHELPFSSHAYIKDSEYLAVYVYKHPTEVESSEVEMWLYTTAESYSNNLEDPIVTPSYVTHEDHPALKATVSGYDEEGELVVIDIFTTIRGGIEYILYGEGVLEEEFDHFISTFTTTP